MNYGEVEEPSSSRSRRTSTARRAATSAILTVILSRSDRASRNSRMVNARPGWDADLNAYGRKIGIEKRPARNQPRFEAEWRWVCRMPSVTERLVVSSPSKCGHIGCCDSSPSQHASKHAAATGHPIIASFEPGEDWFFDYEKRGVIKGGGVASAAFASG
jgi:ubiquitin-hydrolase Zn-finger-containing protein